MTKTARARYTLEFKQEAVRLVEGGQSQASVARTLGLVEQTLFNWIKASRQGQLNGADSKPVSAEQMEISRLRAELARVKMERDILGKATAYFAKGRSTAPTSEVRLHSASSLRVAHHGAVPSVECKRQRLPRACGAPVQHSVAI